MEKIKVSEWLMNSGMSPEAVIRLGNWLGVIFFLGLCAFVYWDSCRAKAEKDG